jgi:hypothetical protein
MGFVIKDLTKRFHATPDELEWVLLELRELGFEWDGSKLSQASSS